MKAASLALLLIGCGDDLAIVVDARAVDASDPTRLSSTGLYEVFANRTLAPGVMRVVPRYALWSDGAVKSRWMWLPDGTAIDASDPAHWRMPVGTKLWKEFAAPDGRKLETRLIERVAATGDDDRDFRVGAFVWLDDESDAVLAPDGATNVRATQHDVPAMTQCRTCHTGEPGFVLGVSTLQLSGPGDGTRLQELAASGRLGATPPAPYAVPGDETTALALGYLHANCGHCHNPAGAARPDVDMTLQLDVTATMAMDTAVWRALVNVPTTRFRPPGVTLRVAPGAPAASAVIVRMRARDADDGTPGPHAQMPPLATEFVDETGVARVEAWIAALPPP